MKYSKLLLPVAVLSLVACKKEVAETADELGRGIQLEYMDTSVKPGDDFFNFVNGTWMKNTEIPNDRTRWGSFDELRKNTDLVSLEILKNATKRKLDEGSDEKKAVTIFETYLDFETRNSMGIQPLTPMLSQIDKVKSNLEAIQLIAQKLDEGSLGFFSIYVGADAKNSNENALYIYPNDLGLPDKDYYVSNDADSQEKKKLYEKHVAKMLKFLNFSETDAKKQAAMIVDLETKLATDMLNRVERRDSEKTYNPMTVAQLQKLTPIVDWTYVFEQAQLKGVKNVIVDMPAYMRSLDKILKTTPVQDIKTFMKWNLLNESASKLTQEIDAANFEFYGKVMTGALEQRPEEERALQVVNGSVGEALGKLYVEEKFPAEAKEKAKEMVNYVIAAFRERISNLDWMAEETKKGAYEKLDKFTVKIGYPDKWEDYSKLSVLSKEHGGNFFENMKNVSKWSFRKNMEDFGKPVDKSRWGMPPQMVNAYFNPAYNEIVFPAAILQPPFYDYKADMAVNFGGIGAVIGHEISHGFDDQGAKYNAEGNLENWWSAADLKQFEKLGEKLAEQYSALQPLPNVFVDGKFTLGENIGDLGGVNAAYDGLIAYLKDKGRPDLIDGYTPEQRFFISWATIWRTKSRDEAIKNQVKTDPHSPGLYRAYVPLQNVDAWYAAFDIQPTDKLYLPKEKRVKIW